MAGEVERLYVIPIKKMGIHSSVAAVQAVRNVKQFLTRHMKVETDKIWIDDSLNKALWNRGKYHVPSKIRVRAVKFDDGVVEAYLPEIGFKKSRRELLKEERERKEPILRKEEVEEEAAAEGEGKEEYEIAPVGDGEVKIKKKKPVKKKAKPKSTGKKEKKPAPKAGVLKKKATPPKHKEKPVSPKKKKKAPAKKRTLKKKSE